MHKNIFYDAAGLSHPNVYRKKQRDNHVRFLFKSIKIYGILEAPDSPIWDLYPETGRRTGKTTNKIMDTIIAEWSGQDVILICRNLSVMRSTHNIWLGYRNKVWKKLGPPPTEGRSSIVSQSRARLRGHINHNTIVIYDECG